MKIPPRSDMLRPEIICIDDLEKENTGISIFADFGTENGSTEVTFNIQDFEVKEKSIRNLCQELQEDIQDYKNEIDDLAAKIANRENILQNKTQLRIMKVKLRGKETELTNIKFKNECDDQY
ncbi:hypothetical protein [Chryseobacterium sp. AG363]|uniref:hypothetical protein n=1 Tax=Chryseobacterium sp. AG363 TaxID=2183997 RepID=UPI000FF1B8A0|nr:hypothetical protein [Chryseobacterium sp. AG363]RKE81993.1 hypothetical protein DEU39_1543 [Chryseobacterium sp. AG363]